MKKSLEEQAERFDEQAGEYDDADHSPEYKAAVSLVVEHAAPGPDETVLDLGTGTGAIALSLASSADHVLGRDISEGMLETARRKAQEREISNVSFATGRFREPNVDEPVDVVVSNFAMHHLADAEKAAAIQAIADLDPKRVVLGDVMLFDGPDPAEPYFDPHVDDPATVGVLVAAFTDAGFHVTAVEPIADQVGVIVAERPGEPDTSQ